MATIETPNRICYTPKPNGLPNTVNQRHPEFYFTDGSIVVRIGQTTFKVHSSILGLHSEIFKDMADMPQPTDGELVDGCPVVDLQDDVKEFTDTLKAIYDPMHFDELAKSDDEISLKDLITFLSGILRITTKYNMPKLRRKCISFLEAKFPSKLDGCLALLKSGFRYSSPDIVRLIALAGARNGGANIPSVLPWAYYLCTHMPVDDIINDEILTWECKALCLAGKEKLWQAFTNISHPMLFKFTPAASCTSGCSAKIAQMAIPSPYNPSGQVGAKLGSMPWKEAEDFRQRPHPLEEYSQWNGWKQQVCSRCYQSLAETHMAGRQKVWEELPTYFGLGSWDEIRRDESS